MVTSFEYWFYFKRLLIWSFKLAKNPDPDKCVHTSHGIGFVSGSAFSLPDGSMGKNTIIFGAGMSSSLHNDHKNKDILVLGEGQTQWLDDTSLTAEAKYPINLRQSGKRFVLSLHYNGSNTFLFFNATRVYQFKPKVQTKKKFCWL